MTAPDRSAHRIELDRHSPRYRLEFEQLTDEFHSRCPVAWNDTHGGYWFVNGNPQLFEVVRRADVLSSDHDPTGERRGYKGITIPSPVRDERAGPAFRAGFIEMDPPEQRHYRSALNPYLSPAAVLRWQPVLDELTHACIDEKIESGRIDFVDDLANIVPAVLTMAMLGLPLADWTVYCEPMHASIYTPPDSPDMKRVSELHYLMAMELFAGIAQIRATSRPGLIDALLKADIVGNAPNDMDVFGSVSLLIGGGLDTTTALISHSLEWLSENPEQRERLSRERDTLLDRATEEFVRFYTPAQGDGRTVAKDIEIDGVQLREGDRLWVSWAMANRDAGVFEDPHTIKLDRTGNRHAGFGLGVHRCIGSNVARATFKTMLTAVLDRMPDFRCDPDGALHYDSTAVINGMRHLPATFTPGPRVGRGLDAAIEHLQQLVDDEGLAEPVTRRRDQQDVD